MDSDSSKQFEQRRCSYGTPDAPVADNTIVACQDELHDEEGLRRNSIISDARRPWHRRPSAWWMLCLVPISTMSSTGVDPSAIQIFTDLACRSLRPTTSVPTCASDPKVEAAVSWLMTAIVTSVGVLSCLTAASWTSFSDRVGRNPVLAIASVGLIIRYSVVILVYYYADYLPGGAWFCVVGSSFYGLLGGTAAMSALPAAYITDCTPPHDRARMLTITHGLRYTGMALGPTFASFLVQFFDTPVASVYFMVGNHIIYFILVFFVIPESLGVDRKEESRRLWEAAARASNRYNQVISLAHMFLRPFDVLKPRIVHSVLLDRSHKDWCLACIAVSWGFASLVNAARHTLCQYGAATFGWTAVELGYWTSSTMVSRALTLTVVIPLINKMYHWLKPSFSETEPSGNSITDDNTPLLGPKRRPMYGPLANGDTHRVPHHTPLFDLTIARLSLLLEVACFGIFPLFASAPLNVLRVSFIVLTVLSQCGAAFNPALQSLASEVYASQGGTESGKLFGTLNAIVVIASQIVGPALYGVTFSAIVETYPLGIFFVSVGTTLLALAVLFFVRLPKVQGTRLT